MKIGTVQRQKRTKRGATLLSYGLVVGLIAVIAIGAVTNIGSNVVSLFTEVADSVEGTAQASSEAAPPVPLTPAALAMIDVSGTPGSLSVIGPGSPATGDSVTFEVSNSGQTTSQSLSAALDTGTNFNINSDGCTGQTLAENATCQIIVTATASANGSYNDTLTVTGDSVLTAAVASSATGFGCPSGQYPNGSGGCTSHPNFCNTASSCVTNPDTTNLASGTFVSNYLWDSGADCGNDYAACGLQAYQMSFSSGVASNVSCSSCTSGTMTCYDNTSSASCSGMINTGYCVCN